MDLSDEMRQLRQIGGDSAVHKEHVRQTIEQIAKCYRAVDTARQQNRGKDAANS